MKDEGAFGVRFCVFISLKRKVTYFIMMVLIFSEKIGKGLLPQWGGFA